MPDPHRLDPAVAFARIGGIKLGDTDLEGVLRTIAEVAKQTIPGADEVSVTLIRDTGAGTAAYTGEAALALDESQYEQGHGPCLDAAGSLATVRTLEMSGEDRWPWWTKRAADAGVLSALAVGLPVEDDVTGALNIYATEPDAFDEDAVLLAQTFAGFAAVALTNAHGYDRQATLAQHMQAAMDSRAVIEQAKGIIMGDRRCTADEAFRMLTQVSQHSNRKVRDVAAALVARAAGARAPDPARLHADPA